MVGHWSIDALHTAALRRGPTIEEIKVKQISVALDKCRALQFYLLYIDYTIPGLNFSHCFHLIVLFLMDFVSIL